MQRQESWGRGARAWAGQGPAAPLHGSSAAGTTHARSRHTARARPQIHPAQPPTHPASQAPTHPPVTALYSASTLRKAARS